VYVFFSIIKGKHLQHALKKIVKKLRDHDKLSDQTFMKNWTEGKMKPSKIIKIFVEGNNHIYI